MTPSKRFFALSLWMLATMTGCQPGSVVFLEYDGFRFEGRGYGGDFGECWVAAEGVSKMYVTGSTDAGNPFMADKPPGKRLSDFVWEDFQSRADYLIHVSGTPEKGWASVGSTSFAFENGKIVWADLRGDFKMSGSADGPFIEFSAFEGQGPKRKDIEAAFGKPKKVSRMMGRRGP